MQAWKYGGAGEGRTHLSSPSRHLSIKDGFGGWWSSGAVADGRLLALPGHREGAFRVNETETTFIETKKALNLMPNLTFEIFCQTAADVATETPDLLTYLI